MAITNLNHFLQQYFISHDCKLVKNIDGVLTIQLTEEMDLALMNRPFYWHYVKKTGNNGKPLQLTLITNPEKRTESGEWIHFGSPRLQQLWNYLIQNEKYTHLFQEVKATKNTALYPWLLTNIKISYKGTQKKEEIVSLGIQLLNGKIVVNMMEELDKLSLKQQISDYCYTISPIIKIKSAYLRMEALIMNYIENQSKDWAEGARKTLEEELHILKHFYLDDLDNVLLEKEVTELKNRYEPEINLEVVNGGLLFLSDTL